MAGMNPTNIGTNLNNLQQTGRNIGTAATTLNKTGKDLTAAAKSVAPMAGAIKGMAAGGNAIMQVLGQLKI